jgi:EAL domain-containing protein (putative c-di-GMP-specific phosphodiesterase class I)
VSGRHRDTGDLLADVSGALASTGARADRLVVEMTETQLVRDLDRVANTLGALRDLGLGIAVDDFSTGYSSVARLRRLPATHLKIDRSFISGSTDPTDRSILELLAWSGAALDLEVIAEGVEEEGQPTPGPWPRSFPG